MMKSYHIRKIFLEFFKENGHEIVKSSSLVPVEDPSLLFTNAGMVQFKGVFLGHERKPYSKATSCQKCMRAGGKHSDLENVGHTARHHTFFEMLGNFSFGDYFKKEAIKLAWKLITEKFGLHKDKLWVSIYEEDKEAEKLWKEETDILPNRIIHLGAKDNFWQMGDTGPCGPCSEIIIDQGEEVGCGRKNCSVGCDCDRYLELWNLVFMQYNRDADGNLIPLPKPSIDTGMGLERITAVLQGKKNNFDTDLFLPIIEEISSITGVPYKSSELLDISIRVIADHIRASVFLISEGLIPSNEGRGYVLRRIIRRASRHARKLGIESPILYKIADSVVSVMGSIYPEIGDEIERTKKFLKIEEERFSRTLQMGMNILDELIERAKKNGEFLLPGEEIFRLYDTYGFPLDLAKDIAIDEGLKIDEEIFYKELQTQRKRSLISCNEKLEDKEIYTKLLSDYGKTNFVGYNTFKSKATIKAILKNTNLIEIIKQGEEGEVLLDKTPFYGESGGQVGDTGIIQSEKAYIKVIDTKKPIQGIFIHKIKVKRGNVRIGDKVECFVDEERRKAIMKNHTATHLLHKALKIVLGEHVRQAGSEVSFERLRFDFTHYQAVEDEEIKTLENIVNQKIMEDLPVLIEEKDLDKALESGAVALFDEKYADVVRVVSIGDFSKELCGGTHCKSTGEIGLFIIISEGSVASGIRRIEAVTAESALKYVNKLRKDFFEIEQILKTDKPIEKIKKLLFELKKLQKEVEKLKTGSIKKDDIVEIVKTTKEINGVKIIIVRKDGLNQKELRLLTDNVKKRFQQSIIIAVSVINNQAVFVCMVSKNITNKFSADKIMKALTKEAGGSGGGKPEMAQGGTKHIDKIEQTLKKVFEIIKSQIKSI